MSEREYDEATCITAGALRARGLEVPANIPDVGWVPRDSVRFDTKAKLEGDTLKSTTTISFDVPFRWVDVRVRIEPSDILPKG